MTDHRRLLFSDVDGTLCFVSEVHGVRAVGIQAGAAAGTSGLIELEDVVTGERVPGRDVSTSSYAIYMAESTRRLLHGLRERFQIVLVTGGRPATVARRAAVLDFADAVICESGGVILDRDLRVDPIWQERMRGDRRALPVMAARLRAAGWHLDAEGRTSALRVRLLDNPERSADEFARLCRDVELLPGLQKTMNLDHLDIILASAGKANAVRHYAARMEQHLGTAVGIGDDINDIEFLAEVGEPHVLASAFPELLVEARRRGWFTSRARCIRGIDEILTRIGAAAPC